MKRLEYLISVILLFSLLLGACGSTADEKGAVPGDSPDNTSVEEGSAPANVALDSDESNGFIAQVTSAISVDLSWTPTGQSHPTASA